MVTEKTEKKEKSIGKRILEIPYWYHRVELPAGNITPGWSPICAEKYGIPDDLTGKRVLDIGAWDGYWTFEALKRGAKEVVAIDDFSDTCGLPPDKIRRNKWETFDLCREALGFTKPYDCAEVPQELYGAAIVPEIISWENDKGQICKRLKMSVYEVEKLGHFDIVFMFGVNYHLMFPLLALGRISDICDGEIYLETAALDDYTPYRNIVGKGYNKNDMVMEFYPGAQYGNNPDNWWVPTLQCLGAMVESVGFKNIQAWSLTEKPKTVPECRGFVYGTKADVVEPNVEKLAGIDQGKKRELSVAAVMSVPRLGFQDNSFCVFEGLVPLGIPLQKTTGAYWGQCLERAIMQQIDVHNCDAVLTIDYDTLFKPEDVEELVRLMIDHPESDAIVSLQMGRGDMQALMTVKTKTGQVREIIQREEFAGGLLKIATGHFGLTLIRTESLMRIPHPWFVSEPNDDGLWEGGRKDADINFWKKFEAAGMTVYSANRVVIGHLELVAKWPNENLEKIYQTVGEYQEKGKPENVWK